MVRRSLLVALAAATLLTPVEREAAACTNVTQLSADERIAQLHEAEVALGEGNVDRARELARTVTAQRHAAFDPDTGRVIDPVILRAQRIEAVATIRDADASAWLRRSAVEELRARHAARPDPTADADYAEALSHEADAKQRAEGYAILAPFVEKDLVGSAPALGAFARLAKELGDESGAALARTRCEAMIGAGPVCRGDYPRPPLLHGTTRAYAFPLAIALLALAFRVLRPRRPWTGHAAPLQALAILGAGLYAFLRAGSPVLTTMLFGFVVALTLVVERHSFFAAARRGKIAGLVLRPSVPEDAQLPLLSLFFGPRLEQTLEQESNTGYRDAPRKALWRLGRRHPPIAVSFAAAVLVTVIIAVLAALLLGFVLVGLRSAGSVVF